MSDDALSRPEDGVSYEELQTHNFKLQLELEQLKAENASLKQQLRDALCHPLRPNTGPVQWCLLCGNPYTGRSIDHANICKA